jgi:hypothetical protein
MESGKSEAAFPGIPMRDYDISPDGKQLLYSSISSDGRELRWAPLDGSSPARRIAVSDTTFPRFGPAGKICFMRTEANVGYLEQINQDGSGLSKVFPYPIIEFMGFSPGRRWLMVAVTFPSSGTAFPAIIPLAGGSPRVMCAAPCSEMVIERQVEFVPVASASETSVGRKLAIPIGPDETVPALPAGGITPSTQPDVVPGSRWVNRDDLIPGGDPSQYAEYNGASESVSNFAAISLREHSFQGHRDCLRLRKGCSSQPLRKAPWFFAAVSTPRDIRKSVLISHYLNWRGVRRAKIPDISQRRIPAPIQASTVRRRALRTESEPTFDTCVRVSFARQVLLCSPSQHWPRARKPCHCFNTTQAALCIRLPGMILQEAEQPIFP